MRVTVTAKNREELNMRITDLEKRGFVHIKTHKQQPNYSSGYVMNYYHTKYDREASDSYVKYLAVMERE